MDKKPQMFLARANQHTQEINTHFDETLNHFDPVLFVENQEQNESYAFKYMLLQPYKSYFILDIIKEVESHESIIHWTLIKNSEVNIKYKNKYGNLKTILSIFYFKRNIFPYIILMKYETRLSKHGLIQQWVVN